MEKARFYYLAYNNNIYEYIHGTGTMYTVSVCSSIRVYVANMPGPGDKNKINLKKTQIIIKKNNNSSTLVTFI